MDQNLIACHSGFDRDFKPPKSVNTDHDGRPNLGFAINVLMTMDEKLRLGALDIADEPVEPEVYVVVSVMNSARRVVGDKDIHRREVCQQVCDLVLVKQVVSARLIPPAAGKPAETHAAQYMLLQMEVNNWSGKRAAAVMIALHRENVRSSHLMPHTVRSPGRAYRRKKGANPPAHHRAGARWSRRRQV